MGDGSREPANRTHGTVGGVSDFCLVVTSRGRPESWDRLSEALDLTTSEDIDVWLILDDDDETAELYGKGWDSLFIGPRLGHVGSLNEWCTRAASEGYRVVGQMGDDHLPRTHGWDKRISDALRTPGIAYGNDLFQGANLPTAVFFHGDIIRATGKFAPEGLWHLYADNYWRDLGQGAGCLRYLPDVIIEHLHPHAGKSDHDQTYEDSTNAKVWDADAKVWEQYQRWSLDVDVAKVRAIL